MKYAVAIDIGGTNTRVALIDEKYKIDRKTQQNRPYASRSCKKGRRFRTRLSEL